MYIACRLQTSIVSIHSLDSMNTFRSIIQQAVHRMERSKQAKILSHPQRHNRLEIEVDRLPSRSSSLGATSRPSISRQAAHGEDWGGSNRDPKIADQHPRDTQHGPKHDAACHPRSAFKRKPVRGLFPPPRASLPASSLLADEQHTREEAKRALQSNDNDRALQKSSEFHEEKQSAIAGARPSQPIAGSSSRSASARSFASSKARQPSEYRILRRRHTSECNTPPSLPLSTRHTYPLVPKPSKMFKSAELSLEIPLVWTAKIDLETPRPEPKSNPSPNLSQQAEHPTAVSGPTQRSSFFEAFNEVLHGYANLAGDARLPAEPSGTATPSKRHRAGASVWAIEAQQALQCKSEIWTRPKRLHDRGEQRQQPQWKGAAGNYFPPWAKGLPQEDVIKIIQARQKKPR